MKKYCCLLFLSCLYTIAHSQEKDETKFKKSFMLGINAGAHRSFLGGDSGYANFYHKNQFNYMAGINAELKLGKLWSVYTNLNYKPKRFGAESTILTPDGIQHNEEEFRFSYLELPVMAKYRINNSFFYLNGGIYFAKLLSVKSYVNGEDSGLDFSDSFNKLDLGVVLGAGFIFYENEKETTNMSLEFRYIHGLTGLVSHTEGDSDTLMNAYCLQLNYNFTP